MSDKDRIAAALAVLDNSGMYQSWDAYTRDIRAALTPPPARHTFGGVVFEEHGRRRANAGEYQLVCDGLVHCLTDDGDDAKPWPILVPVALESGA